MQVTKCGSRAGAGGPHILWACVSECGGCQPQALCLITPSLSDSIKSGCGEGRMKLLSSGQGPCPPLEPVSH